MARFGAHHAFLLTAMLARVDAANADIAGIEEQITVTLGESHDAASRLVTIPRIGACLAVAIIAEIGVDMSRFPTAGHLCSWAKFAPVTQESAGKARARPGTGHVNKYLARSLGEAAVMAGRSDTFLGARYRRIARRRGAPGYRRGGPLDPRRDLAHPVHPGSHLHRPRRGLLRVPDQPRTQGP